MSEPGLILACQFVALGAMALSVIVLGPATMVAGMLVAAALGLSTLDLSGLGVATVSSAATRTSQVTNSLRQRREILRRSISMCLGVSGRQSRGAFD
jgi:hypothetical protein